jgi:DNA-binding HxlR family transcriptional regulator
MDAAEIPVVLRREKIKEYGCAVELAIDVIGGRWKPLIIYHLREGERRFGELRKLFPAISKTMLTRQLRELEEDGVVRRKVSPVAPPKTEYSLTSSGAELLPALDLLWKWGHKQDPTVSTLGKKSPVRRKRHESSVR